MRRRWTTVALGTVGAVALMATPALVPRALAQQAWTDLDIVRPGQSRPTPPPPRPQFKTLIDDALAVQVSPGTLADGVPSVQPRAGVGKARTGIPALPAPERMQSDGETEPPVSAESASDGQIDVSEPQALPDGVEPFADDPRLPQDRVAMLGPPAGYDQLAFQIEIDPVSDARTARLARFEPFTPVGKRAGSWVVFPTLEAGVTATSNVYAAPNAQADANFDVRPTMLLVSDWQRHALQFKATALGSAYDRFATENDRSYGFEARGRLDIAAHANIEILAAHGRDQLARTSVLLPTDAAQRTPYTTDKLALAYNQKINRLTVQIRGTITGTDYQSVLATDGSPIDTTASDLVAREGTLRAAWHFNPVLALFAETAYNTQTYRAVPGDGIGRDSTGNRARAGLSFGGTSQIWRGELSVGYGQQIANDSRLQNVEGLLLDGNIAWRPTQLTALLLNVQTDFVTSTLPGQGTGTQHSASLEMRHALQRRLNGIASVSVAEIDFQGSASSQRQTTGTLGLEYALSQSTTLLGRYQHSLVTSTQPVTTAAIDSVRVGVRYQP